MIKLRKIEPNDLPFLYQWENDAASWADGANHNPLSQQDLRDYIASTTGDIYRDGQLRLIIEQITNDQSPGASSRQTGGAASAEKGYHQLQNPFAIQIRILSWLRIIKTAFLIWSWLSSPLWVSSSCIA